MSIAAYEAVWERSKSKGSQRLVMLSLAEHADETGSCWPSIKRISERTNVSKRQVIRALSELVGMGEISHIPGDGRGNYSKYEILIMSVKDDTMSPIEEAIKGDICDIKGDTMSERVTNATTKGDTMSYRTVIEPSQNLKEPSKGKPPTPKAKRKKRKTPALTFEIPDTLNTPAFSAAWNDYITHRREIKKPLTPLAAKKQLNQLQAWGLARAIAAINYSIAKGWQSIYENKDNSNGHKNGRVTPAPASERVGGAY